ncbi:copper amine oxidase N-terminal domain-containing protein [Paenibacillus frigoriresistens]|uniref:copper amine oxidase N-terminal domain-containing protein n=1 Tax=Paenibacillus alginolyticus TaxID=59839 RepID=UPI0015671DE6|nr:copper amine oxidase N-terminal domain-containing protein [Paenibacillus frigoriresistens]NRF90063.1 copper amine oxidase N-terminal domain-containing protein [Paenibacillus frigoriresistens]
MRKFLAIALSVSLALSSVVTVTSVAFAESKYQITEDQTIAASIKSFTDIKALFTDKTVLADVQKLYIDKFQTEVKRIDTTIKADDPKIDANITLVLDSAIKGDLKVDQAKQAIDKGLQWYYFLAVRDLVNNQVRPALTKGDTAGAKAAFDKVVQIYEAVLEPNVVKRDAKYSLNMVALLKTTIELMQKDIKENNLNEFNVHRQFLDKTLIKNYTLATFTYAESMATKAPADQPAAMTEAYFLYMPVYTYLRGGSIADANFVKDAFASGDVSKVKKEEIQNALHRTMIGKVSEYVNQVFTKLEAGDLQGARGYVAEANMFLASQEVFLGKEKYAAAVEVATKFSNAVDKSDIAGAKEYGFQLLKFQVGKDGSSLKISSKDYQVDGAAFTAENAPFINAESGRTLVPVRVIAQAIQAQVEWVDATKTVVITKDGKKTEITLGSDQVVENGKVNEKVKLDQPVIIENGSSFIPLRAVAELFSKRVFYQNGEIIILR